MRVYIAVVSHEYVDCLYSGQDEIAAIDAMYQYVKRWWDDEVKAVPDDDVVNAFFDNDEWHLPDSNDLTPLQKNALIRFYFENTPETYAILEQTIET